MKCNIVDSELHTPSLTCATRLGYNLSLDQTPPTVLSLSMMRIFTSGRRRRYSFAAARPNHPITTVSDLHEIIL